MRRLGLAHWAFLLVVGCGGDGGSLAGPPATLDQDSDGVVDAEDGCPNQAETRNEWEDEDGCPDTTDELYQLARTDIEDYWLRTFTASNQPYLPIQAFVGYDAPISTACGPTVLNNASYCGGDHGIYYHIAILDEFLKIGPYAPQFVIAHEFGHAVQKQLGFTRPPYFQIELELQADCLAGAYTRDAKARGLVDDLDIEAAVVGLFRVRDRPGIPWFDPNAHGTAGLRIDAFNAGVERDVAACVSAPAPPPPPPPPGTAATSTTITSDSPDPSQVGQAIVVVVRVTSEAATPTGTVTVTASGSGASCSATLNEGLGSCELILTQEGTSTLTATYAGSSDFNPSSDTEPHTVGAARPPPSTPSASTSTVAAAPATIQVGTTSTITVTVKDAAGSVLSAIPVTLSASGSHNTITPAVATTTAAGIATFSFSSTVAETKTITATAAGVPLNQLAVITVQETPPPNSPPIAEFVPPSCTVARPCQFTDASVDPDGGELVGWNWAFGDGATSTSENPSHSYDVAGTYDVQLTVQDDEGSTDDVKHQVTVTETPPTGGRLAITTQPSSPAQSGVPFPTQPVIQVVDQNGNPSAQPNIRIEASISSGPGGSLDNSTATTDASGRATFSGLTLTGAVGNYTLSFNAPGLAGVSSAPLTITAGPPAQLDLVTAPSTMARSRFALVIQPVVQVQDASGNPIRQAGTVVVASVTAANTTISGETATTDENGRAVFSGLTLTGIPGPRDLTFSATGLQSASARVTLVSVATVSAAPSHPTSAPVGTTVAGPVITWTLRDAATRPVADADFTLIVPSGGTAATLTPFSDANGAVQVGDWTLGTTAGYQYLVLRLPDGREFRDSILATPDAPADLIIHSGDGQSAPAGQDLPQPLVARVVDRFGNGVPNVPVQWATCDGAAGPTVNTDAGGFSSVTQPTTQPTESGCTRASIAQPPDFVEFHYTVTGTASQEELQASLGVAD
jgi:predicted metalloprotease/PKD repeat protein